MNAQFGNGVEAGDSAVDNRRPPQPLVLYDGDCGFCARSVALTRGRWFRAGVAVEAFQRADLLVHNLTVDKCAEVLHVVDTDGVVHFSYANPNYCVRVSPAIILAAAREMLKKTLPVKRTR